MSGAADATRHLVVAETPRVRIRHKRREDAIDDYSWRRDPRLQRFNAEPVYDAPFETFLVQFEFDLEFGHDRRGLYSIETLSGLHIGNLMYYNADRLGGAAEFGMSIADQNMQGIGLGRETAAAFLRYVWRELPFRRVVLHTLEWNERAQRAFASAGFDAAGRVIRAGDAFIRMEALRERWLFREMEGEFQFPAAPGLASPPSVHSRRALSPDRSA
jgi:RimJ/RimL family protein N-acetyltransferase